MDETLDETLENYLAHEKIHNWEGDRGVENFEKLCRQLGYTDSGFRFGTPIEKFLSDCPGAIETLVDFIAEARCEEWREALTIEDE